MMIKDCKQLEHKKVKQKKTGKLIFLVHHKDELFLPRMFVNLNGILLLSHFSL